MPYNIPNSAKYRNALIIEPYIRDRYGFQRYSCWMPKRVIDEVITFPEFRKYLGYAGSI